MKGRKVRNKGTKYFAGIESQGSDDKKWKKTSKWRKY
jgi:hypothetical protein